MTHVDEGSIHPREFRLRCRSGVFTGPTAGVCRAYVQANLVVLRESVAAEFEAFCRANPGPCPLLETLPTGSAAPARIASGADLRTDLPRYRVLRFGECVERPTSVESYWDEAAGDGKGAFRAFLIGCSFTFEDALLAAGVPVRHVEQRCNVPMYRTNIACTSAGVFHGSLVVSMRPMTPSQAERAAGITAGLPGAHGPPVHLGDPSAIGVRDLSRPDYGDPVTVRPGEVPVFWACGVTPMEAILRAKLYLAITHDPGHMFVTDLRADELPKAFSVFA